MTITADYGCLRLHIYDIRGKCMINKGNVWSFNREWNGKASFHSINIGLKYILIKYIMNNDHFLYVYKRE